MMEKIRKSIFINAPPSKVFGFMSDPKHLPEVWPSMVDVKNVHTKADGAHDYDWTYKMAGVRFHGHAETVEVKRDELRVVHNEKGIPSTFRWAFEPRDKGTEFIAEVEYEIPGKMLSHLAAPFVRRINEREAQMMLENTKEALETA